MGVCMRVWIGSITSETIRIIYLEISSVKRCRYTLTLIQILSFIFYRGLFSSKINRRIFEVEVRWNSGAIAQERWPRRGARVARDYPVFIRDDSKVSGHFWFNAGFTIKPRLIKSKCTHLPRIYERMHTRCASNFPPLSLSPSLSDVYSSAVFPFPLLPLL